MEDTVVEGINAETVDLAELLNHPFLVELQQHLTSRHGKSLTEREARQIVMEVARYLRFCEPNLNKYNLYNAYKLDLYLKEL